MSFSVRLSLELLWFRLTVTAVLAMLAVLAMAFGRVNFDHAFKSAKELALVCTEPAFCRYHRCGESGRGFTLHANRLHHIGPGQP